MLKNKIIFLKFFYHLENSSKNNNKIIMMIQYLNYVFNP